VSWRGVGHCHGCRREGQEVADHGGRLLCAECAVRVRSGDPKHCPSPHRKRQPSPVTRNCIGRTEPEVEHLLRRAAEGELEPVRVELPPLPHWATQSMRRVAAFYELVRGVRLAEGDDRDVLFGGEWVAEHLALHPTTVWRAITRLVACGALVRTGELPARGKRRPGLYAPGLLLPAATVGVEAGAEIVPDPGEPQPHLRDESLMPGAELAGVHRMAFAVRDGALVADFHAKKSTAAGGGERGPA
jgi:hypothetical protein